MELSHTYPTQALAPDANNRLRARLRYAADLLASLSDNERRQAVWVWKDTNGSTRTVSFNSEYSIGRDEENTIFIPDVRVSRKQALVKKVAEGWKLTNLSTARSTAINAVPVETAFLRQGDMVQVGPTTLVFLGVHEEI